MPNNKSKDENTNYWPLILLSVGVIGLFAFSWWWLATIINDPEKQGQFGDQFGAVNALFSGLAFAGLIFTIILQKKELALQREELSQTKDELRGQKEQLAEQNKTLKIQRFENTFFHMMELQQQIVNDLYAKEEEKRVVDERSSTDTITKNVIVEHTYKGRDLFVYSFLESKHNVQIRDNHTIQVFGLSGVMEMKGFSYYDKYYTSTFFDHYFRHFYRILKFIKQNENWLSFDEQYQYSSLLRATLSRFELVWLYYNGLSENGRDKLKPLLEEYSMLKNLRPDLLILSKENKDKLEQANKGADTLRDNSFPGTDYMFFLSDMPSPFKYSLNAFCNKNEMEDGKAYYDNWIKFCNNNNIVLKNTPASEA